MTSKIYYKMPEKQLQNINLDLLLFLTYQMTIIKATLLKILSCLKPNPSPKLKSKHSSREIMVLWITATQTNIITTVTMIAINFLLKNHLNKSLLKISHLQKIQNNTNTKRSSKKTSVKKKISNLT